VDSNLMILFVTFYRFLRHEVVPEKYNLLN
jgi:hypothetical protein